ncbi:MAG: hypothetical protein HY465_03745 [Deltaproteobacteria bacterium]|nr:hypothetical protein [Deltaproteobacteria bacterium]
MAFSLGPRRGVYVDCSKESTPTLSADVVRTLEQFDLFYRTLCAMLYNYVPQSGHPGGSISSGRCAATLLFQHLDVDLAHPWRRDADVLSYTAGHKAMGLYALWALRNEIARLGAPELLAKRDEDQLRFEDLLGFRRNPVTATPLFTRLRVKPLDGHPTPATPFVPMATGASGVGVASSIGYALAALDVFGNDAPRVHLLEGEGGMTPGRVAEAMAAAGTASLCNVVVHVDWNQASIDSDRVCREGSTPGDYVQWDPVELAMLHDWNAVFVPDGTDLQQIASAQRKALSFDNGQPTAVVYRTTKGWQYGIEGRLSHGAGHKLCSPDFLAVLRPLLGEAIDKIQTCPSSAVRCKGRPEISEACFWEALTALRVELKAQSAMVATLATALRAARDRLEVRARKPRADAPALDEIYHVAESHVGCLPADLKLTPGTSTTLRAELGRVLHHYNRVSGGAIFAAAADLLGSTSIDLTAKGFAPGYYHAAQNPMARLLSLGGICEDAMAGILSGISSFGHHLGVGSSYGAFLAPLGHIAARLHAIGNQARHSVTGEAYRPMILVCAHAGLKTGEDGPTHADPQALQIVQENFPPGTAVTLTPWDPQELWPLMAATLLHRPAVIFPFVTRPTEIVVDRETRGLAPVGAVRHGVYCLRPSQGKQADVVVVLQGSDVANAFVEGALPRLEKQGIDVAAYYIASTELFDLLPLAEQQRIFPEAHAQVAMGITGFTLPTLYRWIRSDRGRVASLHPFRKGHYLGSGQAHMVLAEAGLDAESQYEAIVQYHRHK